MIAGTIVLEDHTLTFRAHEDKVTYTVAEGDKQETFTVPAHKFFKALAIAVHNDGQPNYEDAEEVLGEIRWIP